MNDMDVVIWLRTLLIGPRTLASTFDVTYDSIKVKLLEAADELEQLREENKTLKTAANEAKYHLCEQKGGHNWQYFDADENHGWDWKKCNFCEYETDRGY